MKNNKQFEAKVAGALSAKNEKFTQIRKVVFHHCLNAGFMAVEDEPNNSACFQWLSEVLERNIRSLSLLEQIFLDTCEPSGIAAVQDEVDAKAAAIIKDIAKRIMASAPEYPSPPKDPNTKAKKKLNMR